MWLWPLEALRQAWARRGPRSPGQRVPQKQNHLKHHWGQLRPLWPAPRRLLLWKSPTSEDSCWLEIPRNICPPLCSATPCRDLKWLRGHSGETATPRTLLGSRTQPQLWPLHLGFIPIFFYSSFLLFPEWRQAGRLDCPEALPTSCRRQELGKHTVSPLWERQA